MEAPSSAAAVAAAVAAAAVAAAAAASVATVLSATAAGAAPTWTSAVPLAPLPAMYDRCITRQPYIANSNNNNNNNNNSDTVLYVLSGTDPFMASPIPFRVHRVTLRGGSNNSSTQASTAPEFTVDDLTSAAAVAPAVFGRPFFASEQPARPTVRRGMSCVDLGAPATSVSGFGGPGGGGGSTLLMLGGLCWSGGFDVTCADAGSWALTVGPGSNPEMRWVQAAGLPTSAVFGAAAVAPAGAAWPGSPPYALFFGERLSRWSALPGADLGRDPLHPAAIRTPSRGSSGVGEGNETVQAQDVDDPRSTPRVLFNVMPGSRLDHPLGPRLAPREDMDVTLTLGIGGNFQRQAPRAYTQGATLLHVRGTRFVMFGGHEAGAAQSRVDELTVGPVGPVRWRRVTPGSQLVPNMDFIMAAIVHSGAGPAWPSARMVVSGGRDFFNNVRLAGPDSIELMDAVFGAGTPTTVGASSPAYIWRTQFASIRHGGAHALLRFSGFDSFNIHQHNMQLLADLGPFLADDPVSFPAAPAGPIRAEYDCPYLPDGPCALANLSLTSGGYTCCDTRSGANFRWINDTDATLVMGKDSSYDNVLYTIELPFNVTWYDVEYDRVTFSDNGVFAFGGDATTDLALESLPAAGRAYPLVAWQWCDLGLAAWEWTYLQDEYGPYVLVNAVLDVRPGEQSTVFSQVRIYQRGLVEIHWKPGLQCGVAVQGWQNQDGSLGATLVDRSVAPIQSAAYTLAIYPESFLTTGTTGSTGTTGFAITTGGGGATTGGVSQSSSPAPPTGGGEAASASSGADEQEGALPLWVWIVIAAGAALCLVCLVGLLVFMRKRGRDSSSRRSGKSESTNDDGGGGDSGGDQAVEMYAEPESPAPMYHSLGEVRAQEDSPEGNYVDGLGQFRSAGDDSSPGSPEVYVDTLGQFREH